ncbi:hypothetical protein [Algoriphagus sp.]|jgi:hypothetical protein|uniref:hypothetical protein n=1 Tax=Algoriphagus sp. TaxID=1872435 RepID=UPI00272066E6|nr:hypothetical protein [Algoriphagus sp.]MDO8968470.1 hypothetical protein [Algoriphagus sp.]MDP3200753.1 hypothetical protein [Algoriphagus sp.]
MRKIASSLFALGFIVLINFPSSGQEIAPPADGPRESPEQRRCPNGKIRTVCEPHDTLGCGDIKGCA